MVNYSIPQNRTSYMTVVAMQSKDVLNCPSMCRDIKRIKEMSWQSLTFMLQTACLIFFSHISCLSDTGRASSTELYNCTGVVCP